MHQRLQLQTALGCLPSRQTKDCGARGRPLTYKLIHTRQEQLRMRNNLGEQLYHIFCCIYIPPAVFIIYTGYSYISWGIYIYPAVFIYIMVEFIYIPRCLYIPRGIYISPGGIYIHPAVFIYIPRCLYIFRGIYIYPAVFIYLSRHLYISRSIYISPAVFIYIPRYLYISRGIYIYPAVFIICSAEFITFINTTLCTNFDTNGAPYPPTWHPQISFRV